MVYFYAVWLLSYQVFTENLVVFSSFQLYLEKIEWKHGKTNKKWQTREFLREFKKKKILMLINKSNKNTLSTYIHSMFYLNIHINKYNLIKLYNLSFVIIIIITLYDKIIIIIKMT